MGLVLLNLCFTNECSDRYKDYSSNVLIPKLFEGWCPEAGEFSSKGDLAVFRVGADSQIPSEIADFQEEGQFGLDEQSLTGLNGSAISAIKQ